MRRTSTRGPEAPHRTATDLEVGQAIRVTSGPLADFDGQISELMPEAGKVKVMLTIFGRETPVELTLDQVASIS
jgi:transcriptional antiterminator NusG